MQDLPLTPDFDIWPITNRIVHAVAEGVSVRLVWDDNNESRYHAFLLRENSPDAASLHPLSREALISPTDLPEDLRVERAEVDRVGALRVVWSHGGHVSRFHPGWLRAHGFFGKEGAKVDATTTVYWTGEEYPEPPTFDGPRLLAEPRLFLSWLEAVRDYGVARLERLPQRDGLLEEVVTRIGPIRESNFGRVYTLDIKEDPDSNAYTPSPLPQHIDLPTRECPPGLQFLYCRENTAIGGAGLYSDGFRIAEDLRAEEPAHFESLTSIDWDYRNRSRDSDYRASGPVVECDAGGRITSIRYNSWLRAPMKAPLDVQEKAYRSFRAFARRADAPRYRITLTYRPGDLIAFDNRRVLHGRTGYDGSSGRRFIEGVYADRDELYSRIRKIRRDLGAAEQHEAAE